MTDRKVELLQGTLDMLVLKALAGGANHGYGVARWIEDATDDVLSVEEGSLYPALHRLEGRGWVDSQWGLSENNRKAKFYSLTREGRERLANEASTWDTFAAAVSKVLSEP